MWVVEVRTCGHVRMVRACALVRVCEYACACMCNETGGGGSHVQAESHTTHTCQVLNGCARRVGGVSQVRSTCVSRAKSRERAKHHLKRAHKTCNKAHEPCASPAQSIGTSSPTVWTRDTGQIGGILFRFSSCAWDFPCQNTGRCHACGEAF